MATCGVFAVEIAKQWRGDKMLRQLEAMLIVMDKTTMLLVSGTGEVIEPDDGILAIGSRWELCTFCRSCFKAICK